MLNLTYEYRLQPTRQQEMTMLAWLETCRKVHNYALRERKDWSNSRKCQINACNLRQEYIIPADAPYPGYHRQCKALAAAKSQIPELTEPYSHVLQQTLNTLDKAFESMRKQGFGYPRFKKPGQMRSFLFPSMGVNPLVGNTLKLPKLGIVKIRLSRPLPRSNSSIIRQTATQHDIPVTRHQPTQCGLTYYDESLVPSGFVLKQCRIVKRVSGWYAMLVLSADVNVPSAIPHGNPLGIDLGLLSFVATSSNE